MGFKYDKVFKLQKRIIRILSLSKYNANAEPIFKMLKLLKIFKLQELKFYYEHNKNKLPHYLQSLPFNPNTETQPCNSHTT